MVVLLDLSQDDYRSGDALDHHTLRVPFEAARRASGTAWPAHDGPSNGVVTSEDNRLGPERLNQLPPQLGPSTPQLALFTAALRCYPVILEIAHSIDLNTLHALSMTCRHVRHSILPYRRQLIKQTLRCEHEATPLAKFALNKLPWMFSLLPPQNNDSNTSDGRGTTSMKQIGRCARDLVSECRRCDGVICRNCIYKPPPPKFLVDRHRRLCPTCLSVGLSEHLLGPDSPTELLEGAFTSPAFLRDACCCEERVWLCHSCGQSRQTTDTTYQRVWRWRTRYSTYLGGLGTGIGEGNEGVKCGRDMSCLAVREVEVEVDCEGEDLAGHMDDETNINHDHNDEHTNNSNIQQKQDQQQQGVIPQQLINGSDGSSSESDNSPQGNINGMTGKSDDHREKNETGYLRQEIEGIGGVVKKKLKTRVRVGAVVDEYEDEREHADYLAREVRKEQRSWCGWCDRVIPSRRDLEE